MAKSIKEIKALTSRGAGFGNSGEKTTIELSPADVAAITNAAAKENEAEQLPNTENQSNTNDGATSESPAPAPALDMEAIQRMMAEAIANSNKVHHQTLKAAEETHQAELEQLRTQSKAEVNAALADVESLQQIITTLGLDKFKGESQPVTTNASPALSGNMTVEGTGSPESRRFEAILSQRPSIMVEAQRGGMVRQLDSRASDEYFLNNQDKIRSGLEAEMKAAGFLQGSRTINAPTGITDLPSLAFEYLSANMRNTHFPDLIHWQFATYKLELGQGPGLVIAVPRHEDIPRPNRFLDRVLTTGQRLNTDTQSTQEKNVRVTLLELGLGKDATNTVVGFSTFVSSYSLYNLEQVITQKLGRDYALTKDMGLYEQWFATNRVYYNNAGSPTLLPSEVPGVNDESGIMTEKFLNNLRAEMKADEIPTYDDGCYCLALNSFAMAQYMTDKSSKERDDAMAGMDLVGRMLANSTGNMYGGQVSGYRGKYNGFHFFEQNRYGVGSLDTEQGMVTVASDILMGSSFAFGPRTLAWAEGLPVEIRTSTDDDFQRQKLITWYSHGAPAGLNVFSNAATQGRVVEIRTARNAA